MSLIRGEGGGGDGKHPAKPVCPFIIYSKSYKYSLGKRADPVPSPKNVISLFRFWCVKDKGVRVQKGEENEGREKQRT